MINLKNGDIFFVIHRDNTISKLIAWFMNFKYSHTGLIFEVTDKTLYTLETSDYEVTHQEFSQYINDPNVSFEIWRPKDLNDSEIQKILDSANQVRGKTYGFLQLISLALKDLFKRIRINIPNFIKAGVICCDVVIYGYMNSSIKELQIDPQSIDTKDLYDLMIKSGRFEKIVER